MHKTPEINNGLPDRFAAKKLYAVIRPELEEQLLKIYRSLRGLLEEQGYTPTIKYRVKGFDNYFNKLLKLYHERPQGSLLINDLLGLRVICPFLEDLDIVGRLIADNFEVLELEHKAEQHSFREFGYDSLHMLIRTEPLPRATRLPHSCDVCEIQLRTILQDAWAEVEHELVYKSDIPLPNDSIRRKLASLNASLTLSDLIFQEIRDYQKDVRQRGLKRRQSVESYLSEAAPIDITQLPDLKRDEEELEAPSREHLKSQTLEKLMFKALEAHSNNQFSRAISIYGSILHLKLDPVIRSLVYNHRGMAWFALAENQKALEDFSKALRFNEENVRAWTNRGLVYRVEGKFDQSLEDYRRAIDITPQQFEGYWGRAQTCYEMQFYSRALNDCREVLSRQADFGPAQDLEKALRRKMF